MEGGETKSKEEKRMSQVLPRGKKLEER